MEEIVKALKEANGILVVGHIMPDGDDISSVLTMYTALKRLGKEVIPAIDWKIPWIFEELEDVKEIVNYDGFVKSSFSPDLMLIVDSSAPDRIGRFAELIGKIKTAVVDHHQTHRKFTDYSWVDPTFGACAQMVLRILEKLEVSHDEKLATLNLMGILTDTGFLQYPNADIRAYKDATKLVEKGGKPYVISRMILENKKLEQFKLFAEVLEKMKIEANGLLVYSYITQDMYEKYNCTSDDSSGFVSELRSIRGVEVAVMFMEIEPKHIHVSMRSKEWFDLAEFARSIGGGGHKRAAGASIKGKSTQEVINMVVPELIEKLEQEVSVK
ncbi:MAG: bifunctional oligoribonuclease/PAP phosphatase NrnA [Thermotogaceae bacterium]|nr:bifunctional oligoribonuclease/PAP phosphatase NrnA [Thermotogaceae bacterium]